MNPIESEQPQDNGANELPDTGSVSSEPAKITVLEGNKVLFDDKVGLSPVQIVEKSDQSQTRGNGQGGR